MEIFAGRGDEIPLHTFILKPQHHHDIRAIQCRIKIGEGLRTKGLDTARHQCRWRNDADFGAQSFEAEQI